MIGMSIKLLPANNKHMETTPPQLVSTILHKTVLDSQGDKRITKEDSLSQGNKTASFSPLTNQLRFDN